MKRPSLNALASVIALSLLLTTQRATAQTSLPGVALVPGTRLTLKLDNGDSITGMLLAEAGDSYRLRHQIIGEVSVPRGRVSKITLAQGPDVLPSGPAMPEREKRQPAAEVHAPPEDPDAQQEAPPLPAAEWSGRLGVGFSGSSGNTELVRGRVDASATRKEPGQELSLNLAYALAYERSELSEHRLRSDTRNTWTRDASRWEAFLEGAIEYDAFQDFDVRLSGGGGFAYRFIDNDKTRFLTRIGIGASQAYGGPDTDIVPEAIIGFELRHEFNSRHRLTSQGSIFPSLLDAGDVRAIATATWEIRLDKESNITLRLGAENRYDSTPNSRKRNDVDYFAQLVISF